MDIEQRIIETGITPLYELPLIIHDFSVIDDILRAAVKLNCSDLFIRTNQPIKLSISGRKYIFTSRTLHKSEVIGMLTHMLGSDPSTTMFASSPVDNVYSVEKINLSSNTLGQEGSRIVDPLNILRFRLNATACEDPAERGVSSVLRPIPVDPPTINELKVEQEIVDAVSNTKVGMIAVVGATSSGKSTLLSSLLRNEIETEEKYHHIVTIEAPIEFTYFTVKPKGVPVITQEQVGRDVATFDQGVINTLRQAPSLILVGETRDELTLKASVESALTGHLLLTTLHANDVSSTVDRLAMMFPASERHMGMARVLSVLKFIIAQTLVPKVGGGRVPVKEFLTLTNDMQEKILSADNLVAETRRLLFKHGRPMTVHAKQLHDEGQISDETLVMMNNNYITADQIK